MINVRTLPGHAQLLARANVELPLLRSLGRAVTSKDIDGYQVAANELWAVQYFKCCYCEVKISRSYNDVEHYRPKGRADRAPGCQLTHGYWWLAFNVNNLLFACPSCNRSAKNDRFPLELGGVTMLAEQIPPGKELPLFLDPGGEVNPVEHIKFVPLPFSWHVDYEFPREHALDQQWLAIPRNGSRFGTATIEVTDLNRMELVELRSDYVRESVWPLAKELLEALDEQHAWKVQDRFERAQKLIKRSLPFTALSYDALCFFVDNRKLAAFGHAWPKTSEVGRV